MHCGLTRLCRFRGAWDLDGVCIDFVAKNLIISMQYGGKVNRRMAWNNP
jgi:hypothetical protein